MVDIDFSGVDAFLTQLDALQRSFNESVNERFKMWVQEIFVDIVQLTPQWSGNLASNWFIGVNSQSESEQTIPEKAFMWPIDAYALPYERGDSPAVDVSIARIDDEKYGYLDTVYIYNPTEIAPQVEEHLINIRPVNLLDGRVAMVSHAAFFYSSYQPAYLQ